MTERLDLRRSLRSIRQAGRLIGFALIGGIAAGLALASLQPKTYRADAAVILPAAAVDSQGRAIDPDGMPRNILTEAGVARSSDILEKAGRVFSPPFSASELRPKVTVSAVTPEILQVSAKADSGREAAVIANSVAKEYVAYAVTAASDWAATVLSGSEAQARELEHRIDTLEGEMASIATGLAGIDPRSPEAIRQETVLASMKSEQSDAARQLAILKARIDDVKVKDQIDRRGIRVLDQAAPPVEPTSPKPLRTAALGGLLALAAAVTVVVILDRGDGRLRSRQAIALSVGVPIVASLRAPRRDSVDQFRELLEKWEPGPSEKWALRQAFVRLGLTQPGNLVVLSLAGDSAGMSLAVQVAAFAASMRVRTALVVGGQHRATSKLRSACAVGRKGRPLLRPNLSAPNGHVAGDDLRVELTVTLEVVCPQLAELPTLREPAVVALALSAGFATSETLAELALACDDAGYPLAGVLLANPDSDDGTTGEVFTQLRAGHLMGLAPGVEAVEDLFSR